MKKLFAIILSLVLILAPVPVVNTAHAAGGGGMAKMALGLANGIIGTTIVTNCRDFTMTFDHYIYMAGSLIYVAGEILTGKKKGSDIDSQNKAAEDCKAKMKEGGDYQRCTLEAQKKDEESTKAFIEKKMMWTKATLAVYSLAAIATGVEIVCDNTYPLPFCAGTVDSYLVCVPGTSHLAVEYAVVAAFGYANGGLLGSAMAAGMKAFAGILSIGTSTVSALTSAMSTGYYRLAFYIGAGILVGVILNDLANQKKESERRIAEIQKVIDTLEGADNNLQEGQSTSGAGTAAGALAGGDNPNGPKKYDVKALTPGTKIVKNCWSNSSGSPTFSEAGCQSPIRLQKPNFPGQVSLPTLNEGSGYAIDLANAISSGDLASADIQAGKLIAMAGRIDKVRDEMVGKINADLVKKGKKPIDGKAALKQQVDSFNAAMNKQNPGSGNLSMSDLQNSGEVAVSATTPAPEVPVATAVAAAPVAEVAPAEAPIDLSQIDEGAVGTEGDPNAASGKVASLEDSLGNYESSEGDIAQDTGVSIFKQVSNRYILNYEKIFQRKQINPPLAEPQPSN